MYLQSNSLSWSVFVWQSVISVVRVMSVVHSPDAVQVPGVVCVVVGDEMCRGVCGVRLVLAVVLLRHSWRKMHHTITVINSSKTDTTRNKKIGKFPYFLKCL